MPSPREAYRRYRPTGDEPPATWTVWELTQRKRDQDACIRHLADLVREYGGRDVGTGRAIYRARCELDILPGSEFKPVSVNGANQSYCGSPAAMTAGY